MRLGRWALPAGLGLAALLAVLLGVQVGAADDGASSAVGMAVSAARLATDALAAVAIGLGVVPLLLPRVGGGAGASRVGPGRPRTAAGLGPGRVRAAAGRRDQAVAQRRAARLGVACGAGWAAAVLLGLWLQAADAVGQSPFRVPPALLASYAGQVAAGRAALLTLGCALLTMALRLAAARTGGADGRRGANDRPRYAELALGVGLLGALAGPVTGHVTGPDGHDPAVLAIALHVTAACVWVGGLLAVVVVLADQPSLVAETLPRFSTLAGYCAGVVALSGLVSAALRLPDAAALLGTGYGQLVVAKAGCLLGLVALGWWARRGLLPRLAGQQAAGRGRLAGQQAAGRGRLAGPGGGDARRAGSVVLAGWLGPELALMAVVFGLAAALAGSSPG